MLPSDCRHGVDAGQVESMLLVQTPEGATTLGANSKEMRRLVTGTIPEVDGLRGTAILLVMLHHSYRGEGRAAKYFHLGWIGVDLFFSR